MKTGYINLKYRSKLWWNIFHPYSTIWNNKRISSQTMDKFITFSTCMRVKKLSVRNRTPSPFLWWWDKPTWIGGVMLLPLKIEVWLVIFSPLDLGFYNGVATYLFIGINKKTKIEKLIFILLIFNWIYIDHRKITWFWI